MSSVELARLGARKAAEGVRAGRVSPIDLVEACLARIRGLDDRLTAWSFVDADGARATARERRRAAGGGRAGRRSGARGPAPRPGPAGAVRGGARRWAREGGVAGPGGGGRGVRAEAPGGGRAPTWGPARRRRGVSGGHPL